MPPRKAAWTRRQLGHLIQNEQLIERPVIQRAGKGLLIVIGAVPMIDRGNDVTLAGKVFPEVTQQVPITGVTVGDDGPVAIHPWSAMAPHLSQLVHVRSP